MKYYMFHEGEVTVFPEWPGLQHLIPNAYLVMATLSDYPIKNDTFWLQAEDANIPSKWNWVPRNKVPKEILLLALITT